MTRLVLSMVCAVCAATRVAAAEVPVPESPGTWASKEAFYAERTQPEAFFGPRYFFFFAIPDWPEWLTWGRFL